MSDSQNPGLFCQGLSFIARIIRSIARLLLFSSRIRLSTANKVRFITRAPLFSPWDRLSETRALFFNSRARLFSARIRLSVASAILLTDGDSLFSTRAFFSGSCSRGCIIGTELEINTLNIKQYNIITYVFYLFIK